MMVSGVHASNHVKVLDHPLVMWNQHILGQAVWSPRRLFCQFFINDCMEETYDTKTVYSIWAHWIVWVGMLINQCQYVGALLVNIVSGPFILFTATVESMTLLGCLSLASIFALGVYECKESAMST
jgi:hypothetical protein